MVPIEQLSEKNLLYAYYLLTEIKEKLEIQSKAEVILSAYKHVSPNIRYYPADRKSRSETALYLKEAGHFLSVSTFDEKIYITVPDQEKIFSLCSHTLANYYQRFTKPSEGKVKIDALAEEQIEKLHRILEIVAIKLSMSRLPHIIYIPIKNFPNEIQQSDLLGLLYKADKDFGALRFTNIIGATPSEQEIEIKIIDTTKEKTFFEFQKNIEERYLKIIANKKHAPQPTTPPKREPLEVRLVQGSQIALTETKEEKKYKFPHKLPSGTTWENITLKFLDDDRMQITVQGKTEIIHYQDMGLYGKGDKPSVLWSLLRVLAKYSGEIAITDSVANELYKKQKQGLSDALKSYFSIDYDPFHPYKSGKSYRTKFLIISPEKGFSFEKKLPHAQSQAPKKDTRFDDLVEFRDEIAPIISEAEISTPDER